MGPATLQPRWTTLAAQLESGFNARDRDAVEQGFRDELLEALGRRLEQPGTAERLYPYVVRYYGAALEGYVAIL